MDYGHCRRYKITQRPLSQAANWNSRNPQLSLATLGLPLKSGPSRGFNLRSRKLSRRVPLLALRADDLPNTGRVALRRRLVELRIEVRRSKRCA
jgi:hypothetical protein